MFAAVGATTTFASAASYGFGGVPGRGGWLAMIGPSLGYAGGTPGNP